MASLRISSFLRPFSNISRSPLASRNTPFPSNSPLPSFHQRRLASQDYGSGSGSPEGESPQKQPSSSTSSDKEHPGPAPPDVGKGTGGGPTKNDEGGHGPPQEGPSGKKGKEDVSGARPKILSEGQDSNKEQSEEVRRHNEDMGKRHDRPQEGVDDQGKDYVDKGFWSGEYPLHWRQCFIREGDGLLIARVGQGGADRSP